MKKYFVLVQTKHFQHVIRTDSISRAERIAKMRMWRYAKIHECMDSGKSTCIYIIKEGRVLAKEF